MADLTASQARTISTTDQVIYNEVDTITRAILVASLAGGLSTTVDSGTTITDSVDYYNVWSNQADDRKKSYEYGQVIAHFQRLGYNIVAKKNTVTENTLKWELYW
jgi:hypothetical protein